MMKKDFIVRRSVFYVEGKPHVETYSEEPLVKCENCRYAVRHCSDSVFGKHLYVCKHVRQIGREGDAIHTEEWFCADGVEKHG